jgi:hypothetical protein
MTLLRLRQTAVLSTPGPDGVRLLDVFQVVPIMGNLALGVGRSPTPASSVSPPTETPAPTSRSSPMQRAVAGPVPPIQDAS